MMTASKTSITIIGTGALGSTLMSFFQENDYLIQSTWNSRGGSVYSDGLNEYETVSATLPKKDEEIGDLVFITTPDDLIRTTSEALSKKLISWDGKVVVHCSGNLTSDELDTLFEKGAKTVSMHPIQTFKKKDGSKRFNNIYISLQGDSDSQERLKPLIQEMGAHLIILSKKQKRHLHIAAVMASNYLVALMFSVENLLRDVELEEGFDALETLVHQTVVNIFKKGPADALTGPISRGDIESVQTHLKELNGRQQKNIYKILGFEAVKIAKKSGSLSQAKVDDLRKILSDSS